MLYVAHISVYGFSFCAQLQIHLKSEVYLLIFKNQVVFAISNKYMYLVVLLLHSRHRKCGMETHIREQMDINKEFIQCISTRTLQLKEDQTD